jgi:exodeoxyribonuclease VII large subunit
MAQVTTTPEEPWSLASLTAKLKGYIDQLGMVWVEGEITAWTPRPSGIFGTMKDLAEDTSMSVGVWASAMSRIPEDIKVGDRVVALVKVDFWPKGGNLRLTIQEMKHVGLGDLMEKLERLKAQLRSEGLFDESRKHPLPFLPGRIGLITGANSDAEKDVIRNATLRWPQVEFEVRHTHVQGPETVPEVLAALKALDADPAVDVIVIARGGGDFLNLLPFSDEALVRAVAAATTPVVSAIGHEADQPLLDFVADLRASTPTDAAKRVVPDVNEELARVREGLSRIRLQTHTFVTSEWNKLEQVRSRPSLASGEWIIGDRAEEIVRYVQRGSDLVSRTIENATSETAALRGQLRALSPQSTLDRGYAIALRSDGKAVRTPADAPAGAELTVALSGGRIAAVSAGEVPPASPPKSGSTTKK